MVAILVGFIKPSLVGFWSKNATRGQILLIYGLALVVDIILIGVFAPQPQKQTSLAPPKLTEEEQTKRDRELERQRVLEEYERRVEAQKEELNKDLDLIKAGADVNATNNKGETALMLASAHGHMITTETLRWRADVNAKYEKDERARDLANGRDFDKVIKLLKSAGAK